LLIYKREGGIRLMGWIGFKNKGSMGRGLTQQLRIGIRFETSTNGRGPAQGGKHERERTRGWAGKDWARENSTGALCTGFTLIKKFFDTFQKMVGMMLVAS
jgi:hypothetical protein